MIDRQSERGRSPRGGSIHIQSLPATFDIYVKTYVYLQEGTLWLARSRGGPFSSRFFPRCAREETHRHETPRFLYHCLLKFSATGWSTIFLVVSHEYQRLRSFRSDLCGRAVIVFNSSFHGNLSQRLIGLPGEIIGTDVRCVNISTCYCILTIINDCIIIIYYNNLT